MEQNHSCSIELAYDIWSLIFSYLCLPNLSQVCLVSRKFLQLSSQQIEIYFSHNSYWSQEPVNPQKDEILDFQFYSQWCSFSVTSWDETTMKMGLHVPSMNYSSFVADIDNPLIMSKLRPYDPSASSLYKPVGPHCSIVKFQPRQRPFKYLKMMDPQPNQIFLWFWGNKYHESRIIFAYGSRIVFRYLNRADLLVVADVDLNVGSFAPINQYHEMYVGSQSIAKENDSPVQFQEVKSSIREITKIMLQRRKEKVVYNDTRCLGALREDFKRRIYSFINY